MGIHQLNDTRSNFFVISTRQASHCKSYRPYHIHAGMWTAYAITRLPLKEKRIVGRKDITPCTLIRRIIRRYRIQIWQ